ncbi:D-2-hydroxyacid dehydrogenase [Hydrogenophaga sp. BPS33]|uniref:D-2-hydroxyacid dehydrogenase n=1 Tax=Hydrogenophaga sp. BPS33 TaxID=2651974 RepID=UPI0013569219|nr:D-2-hydroxyacid dehydrogenase [Hydrogenophaga sp. BPS33]
MRIVFASKVARPPVLKALQTAPNVELIDCEDLAQVAAHVQDADALVISDPRGADGKAIADALKRDGCRVKWVQAVTAGVNGLLTHGVPAQIVITNQGGAVAPAVAEHAMAMVLAMVRRIGDIMDRSRQQRWSKEFDPPLMSVEARTMVIVGYGNIGRELAQRAKGFGMKLVGVSRSGKRDDLLDEAYPLERLHDALAKADVVAVTIASVPGTRHVIDAQAIAATKKGAYFTNVSRGETVDPVALRRALESGHFAGAFLDVTDPEPLPADDPLWRAPNLLISPHTAGAGSTQTGVRIARVVVDNVKRFQAGEPLQHTVEL